MSLLDDYEELCNAQDIGIFRETLDEVLKPILIVMDDRYFLLNRKLDEINIQLMNLKGEMESRMTCMDNKIEQELNYAYETHNTKLHNIWKDVVKVQGDLETIQLNLKK